MPNSTPIYVTQPTLPPLDEYLPYLKQIWNSKVLTNNGPLHQELESQLCNYLGVEHLSLFSNGTIALLTALRALDLSGEVITTPFSFAATGHALLWANLTPVFVDIDPVTFNIDPLCVQAAITTKTAAILGVHCYGSPCDIDSLQSIADAHHIPLIFDAAHAFGVTLNGRSLLAQGELSVLSFHATKVFHTFEGGAVVSRTSEMKRTIDRLKNFGITDELTVIGSGLNGKMSELNAAFGLVMLEHVTEALERRRYIANEYRSALQGIHGITVPIFDEAVIPNGSYMPILVDDSYSLTRDGVYDMLKSHNIYTRRYFCPLISSMPAYKHLPTADAASLPQATYAAGHVLCLPIYPNMSLQVIDTIVEHLSQHA